ncbi:MAG: ABC transporter permease [Fimbriiglobus sp.]
MTWTIFWKELREQAAVLIALMALGIGLLAAIAILSDSSSNSGIDVTTLTNTSKIGLILLTVTAGVVVGGTLFAGEREAGTFLFLDRLPGSRWGLWWRKTLVGAVLSAVATIILFVAAVSLGLVGNRPEIVSTWGVVMIFVGFTSFSWGHLGSTFAKNSLAACSSGIGLGLLLFGITVLTCRLGVAILGEFLPIREWVGVPDAQVGLFIGAVLGLMAPLIVSLVVFTGPDRDRSVGSAILLPSTSGEMKAVRFKAPTISMPKLQLWERIRRMIWLMRRQSQGTVMVMGSLALLAGVGLLPESVVFIAAWPGLSLLFGVLLGVIWWSDEQGSEAARFWGERRLRVGGVWFAKIVSGLLATVLVSAIMLVPLILTTWFNTTQGIRETMVTSPISGPLFDRQFPIGRFLLLGPVYGFVFGSWSALLFRKALVAGAVGLMLGGTFGAFWLPSLFAGGVYHLQIWLAPFIILMTIRLSLWAWTTNGLASRGAILRTAFGMIAAILATGVGIGYRAIEVPDIPEGDDDLAFAKDIPTYDEFQAGRDIRRAMAQYSAAQQNVVGLFPREPLFPAMEIEANRSYLDNRVFGEEQLNSIPENGYPRKRQDLDRWLTNYENGPWEADLQTAKLKCIGVVEDPNEQNFFSLMPNLQTLRQWNAVNLALGLRDQQNGNSKAYVERAALSMSVANNVRNFGTGFPVAYGNSIESLTAMAGQRWLESLGPDRKPVAELLKLMMFYDEFNVYVPRNTILAFTTIRRESLKSVGLWLPKHYMFDPYQRGTTQPTTPPDRLAAECDMISFFWAVPWEKERLRRVVGLGNSPVMEQGYFRYCRGMPGGTHFNPYLGRQSYGTEHQEAIAHRRMLIVSLALRLFYADNNKFPATLDELVPKYLPNVPKDPYSPLAAPIRYRIANVQEVLSYSPAKLIQLEQPANPLFTRMDLFQQIEANYDPELDKKRRAAVAALAGAPVLWQHEDLDDPDDSLNASRVVMGMPIPPLPTLGNPLSIEQVVKLQAGQPVLWSVGLDRRDDNGVSMQEPGSRAWRGTSTDIIVVVPFPATSPPAK